MTTKRLDLVLEAKSAISEARKFSTALNQVGLSAKNAQASINRLVNNPKVVSISARGFSDLNKNILESIKLLDRLKSKTFTITPEIKNVNKVKQELGRIANIANALSKKDISLRISLSGIRGVELAVSSTLDTLKKLTDKVTVTVSSQGLVDVRRSVTALRQTLDTISKLRTRASVRVDGVDEATVKLNNLIRLITSVRRPVRFQISTDLRSIQALQDRLVTINNRLSNLTSRSINVRANLASLQNLLDMLNRINAMIRTINAQRISPQVNASGIASLGSQITALTAAITGLNNRAGGGGGGRGGSSGNPFNNLFGPLGRIIPQLRAVALGVGLIGTGPALAGLVRLADSAQQIENRIKLVTNNTEELVSVQGELFRQAQDARTSLSAQADLYQRIALSAEQLGVSQRQVLAGTEAVSKAITLSASSQQAATATIIQFGQALSFGKLRGDELRSVLEQAPRLAQALADGLGIARGELVKFGFAGKLNSDEVFKALLSQLPQLRQEFAKLTPRIQESSTTVINSLTLMSQAINDTTGATEGISRGLLNFADDITAAIPSIVGSLSQIRIGWMNLKELLMTPFEIPGVDFIISKFRQLNDSIGGVLTKNVAQLAGDVFSSLRFDNSDITRTADEIINLQKTLSDLSRQRVEFDIAIDDLEIQKSLGKLQTEINGIPNQAVIDIILKAEEAERKLPEIERQFKELSQQKTELEISLDIEGAEKALDELKIRLFGLKDPQSEAADVLRDQIALRETAIKKVKEESKQLQISTDRQREILKIQKDRISAVEKATPIAVRTSPTPLPSNRDDLINVRDSEQDDRTVERYLNSQRELLATLGQVEGVETELAKLRAQAGDAAVSKVEGVIRAYEALNSAQRENSELVSGAEKRLESLQDELNTLNDLTAAEQIRKDIQSKGVRTEAEQKQLDLLKQQLLEADNLNKATKANVDVTRMLAEARELASKLSPDEERRLDILAQEIQATEELIKSTTELAETRKKADDLIERTVQSSLSDRELVQADITTINNRLDELRRIPVEDRSSDYEAQIANAQKAIEILEKGQNIVVDFGITTESLIQGTAQAMADSMSTFFFDVMQGDFDDLTKNMADTFKRAIDRMVADALAAKITESLFNGIASIGSLFTGGAGAAAGGLPAAQFGASSVNPGDMYRVNETGVESFVDQSGNRAMLEIPRNSVFMAQEKGKIDTAAETRQAANDTRYERVMGSLSQLRENKAPPLADSGTGGTRPSMFEVDGKSFLKMGSSPGNVTTIEDMEKMLSGDKVPGRRLGGSVRPGSLYEVGENGLSEFLNIGASDFMMNRGVKESADKYHPAERQPEIQNIYMTINTPDPDGFRKSSSQIQNEMSRMASAARRRNG